MTGNGHTCLCQAVGLDFFRSMVAACRAGQLSRRDARRFVTNFLESKANSVSSRSKRRTGQCDHHIPGTLCLPKSGFLILIQSGQSSWLETKNEEQVKAWLWSEVEARHGGT